MINRFLEVLEEEKILCLTKRFLIGAILQGVLVQISQEQFGPYIVGPTISSGTQAVLEIEGYEI